MDTVPLTQPCWGGDEPTEQEPRRKCDRERDQDWNFGRVPTEEAETLELRVLHAEHNEDGSQESP